MTSTKQVVRDSSWSSIMREPAVSKILVNYAFSGLSYGVYNNLIYFFFEYLDPVDYRSDFALYYLVFQITMSIAYPPGGILADIIGRKPMLVLGSSIAASGMFVFPLASQWWHLLFASALQAIGFALLGTAQTCVIADVTRGYRREKGYSIAMSFSMIFGVVGTIVLIIYSAIFQSLLPASVYYRIPLLISLVLALIAAVPMFLIKLPRRPQESDYKSKDNLEPLGPNELTKEKDKQSYEPAGRLRRNSVVLKMISFQAIIGLGAGFLIPLFIYYWDDIFHLNQYLVYIIALLGELGVALGGLAAPKIAKRVTRLGGRVGTTVACQLISIGCAVYLSTVPYFPYLLPAVIAFIARQALMNMVNPLIQAMTMDHTPANRRGFVNALTSDAFNIPNGVSPYLSATLVTSVPLPFGYTYSTLILVGTYITGTALLSTTRKKDKLLVARTRQTEE